MHDITVEDLHRVMCNLFKIFLIEAESHDLMFCFLRHAFGRSNNICNGGTQRRKAGKFHLFNTCNITTDK